MPMPRKRAVTFILLGAGFVFAIAALAVGVSDNPPGVLLAFFAAVAVVSAFVHGWRTEKPFRILFFSSFLFVVLAEGAERFERVSSAVAQVGFVAGIVLFPAAFLVGLVGWIVMGIRNRRPQSQS